ncbi:MAG: hypothetical protein ACI37O_05600 [Candidatus Avelusimicrobium sp.]|uniref:hypothetical protein n=1 Tax=Candidatus Avelusimicrobium sp. TaxID=3048833 RepID=UPI003F01ABC7
MKKQIEFEDIRKMYKEYADRIMLLGTDRIIETKIPWNKVFWGREIGTQKILPFFHKKSADGTVRLFCINENGHKQTMSNRDFAYMYDLWDKDGHLLHIAFYGF